MIYKPTIYRKTAEVLLKTAKTLNAMLREASLSQRWEVNKCELGFYLQLNDGNKTINYL